MIRPHHPSRPEILPCNDVRTFRTRPRSASAVSSSSHFSRPSRSWPATSTTSTTPSRSLARPPLHVVGSDDGKILLAARLNEEEQFPYGVPFTPRDRGLLSIDPKTNDALTPFTVTAAAARDIAASDAWFVWIDRAARDVKAYNRAADRTDTYLSDVSGYSENLTLQALSGNRLLLHRPDIGPSDGDEYEFVLLELSDGKQTIIPGSWLYATAALDGDWLVFMHDQNTNVELLGLELSAHVDRINLATSQRDRIASDIRVSGYAPAIFLDHGVAYWQEYEPGSFDSRIVQYNLASDQHKNLIEDFGSINEERRLADVADGHLLISRLQGELLQPRSISVELWKIGDGGAKPLAAYDRVDLAVPILYETDPVFSSGFVIWTHPVSGNLVAYDLATGQSHELIVRL